MTLHFIEGGFAGSGDLLGTERFVVLSLDRLMAEFPAIKDRSALNEVIWGAWRAFWRQTPRTAEAASYIDRVVRILSEERPPLDLTESQQTELFSEMLNLAAQIRQPMGGRRLSRPGLEAAALVLAKFWGTLGGPRFAYNPRNWADNRGILEPSPASARFVFYALYGLFGVSEHAEMDAVFRKTVHKESQKV